MTPGKSRYSDEMLNAFLDDELHSEERKHIIHDLRTDRDLQERLCQLEQIRKMVSIAYYDVPASEEQPATHMPRRQKHRTTIAAGMVLAIVGVLSGWLGHSYLKQDDSLVSLADQVQYNQPGVAQPWKVLLHVTSDDPYRLNIMLEEAEKILREYEHRQQAVTIQVLANGNGLNLLRSDTSHYAKRIAALQKRYHNLIFTACANAMARVEHKTGKPVHLLPATEITPSALGEVLNKQREGWTYIKI